jgi:hypothetical protein
VINSFVRLPTITKKKKKKNIYRPTGVAFNLPANTFCVQLYLQEADYIAPALIDS